MRTLLILLSLSVGGSAMAVEITGLSIPVDSMDGGCRPLDSGIWSVAGHPLPAQSGISWLVDASADYSHFSLHDHHYQSPNVPDPTRAIVTFTFNGQVKVKGLTIVQHANGITRVEGFGGNSLATLATAGNVFGSKGDVTGSGQFAELENESFSFTSPQVGSAFQYVITKTSLDNGYASYRTFLDYEVVPEPCSLIILGVGSAVLANRRRRSQTDKSV